MFKQLVPLDSGKHGSTFCRPLQEFSFAAQSQLASIMVNEFVHCAAHYPIVFLEQGGQRRPVALFGFEREENLFVSPEDGAWQADYVPAILRRYPFALARSTEAQTFAVCVDESSHLLGDEERGGLALFDEGKPSDVLEHAKRFLLELQQLDEITAVFAAKLAEHGLLVPLQIRARIDGEERSVSGCLGVDEARLNALTDEQFIDLRRRGYLIPIYAHLASLRCVNRLLKRKADQRERGPAAEAEPAVRTRGGRGRKAAPITH